MRAAVVAAARMTVAVLRAVPRLLVARVALVETVSFLRETPRLLRAVAAVPTGTVARPEQAVMAVGDSFDLSGRVHRVQVPSLTPQSIAGSPIAGPLVTRTPYDREGRAA